MEGITVEYFSNLIDTDRNEKSEFHLYISDENEEYTCNSHDHIVHILKKSIQEY